MAEAKAPAKFGGAYKENEHHRPDPTHMYDQYNTSGTGAHDDLSDITPVFDHARHRAQIQAGRALDPRDKEVPETSLIFQDGSFDREAAERRVKEAAAEAKKNPPPSGNPGPAERKAANTA